MAKTLGERSKEEDRRVMEEGLRSVSSNYLFCPSLCRTCNNLSESNSTFPYKCNTGHSDHIAYKSEKEGYKQYDECRYFKEKEREKIKVFPQIDEMKNERSAWEIKEEARLKRKKELDEERQNDEERQRQQNEYERTHCQYCGLEEDTSSEIFVFEEYLGHKFHKICLKAIKEDIEKEKEKERKHQEWLNSPEGKRHLAEQERIKKEAEEQVRIEAENLKKEQEKKASETKEKKRLQLLAKLPIFVIVSLVSVFANDFLGINTWLPIAAIAGILFLFYKMLGGMFNAVYDTLNKESETGKTFSKLYRFVTYSIGCVIITAVHCGIVFLVMHVLLKIW